MLRIMMMIIVMFEILSNCAKRSLQPAFVSRVIDNDNTDAENDDDDDDDDVGDDHDDSDENCNDEDDDHYYDDDDNDDGNNIDADGYTN
ncbi:hypothetical protein ElyMa_007013900 [Elysia marginata]|uniref:Uncharacterized protein n=1 Tax=Elysia marginata TaxID=1093978 RepID=A0AAV4JWG7_9GAST|nr:hypothetical protein ElyMa_007013900 [Elysia marginata]